MQEKRGKARENWRENKLHSRKLCANILWHFWLIFCCCCTHEDIVVGPHFWGPCGGNPPILYLFFSGHPPSFCGSQLAITVDNLWQLSLASDSSLGNFRGVSKAPKPPFCIPIPRAFRLLLLHHAHQRKSISSLMQNVTQLVGKIYTWTQTHTEGPLTLSPWHTNPTSL